MPSTSFDFAQFVSRASPDESQHDAHYGYTPQESVAILFIVLFSISTILHIGQATYYRMWWLFPTVCLCGIGELIGWSGRLWSSLSPLASIPYTIQISTTIIAPTPLIAVNFILLTRIVQRLGPSYSWLPPKWFEQTMLQCAHLISDVQDCVALTIQGVGGGMASSANDLQHANIGGHVMLGGIVFQFVTIVAYILLSADFLWRYTKDKPVRNIYNSRGTMDNSLKIMIYALIFSTTVLFIRSVYRTIELSTGWTGSIIHTEVYFNVLDGAMVVLAIYTINFAHPGLLLGSAHAAEGETEKLRSLGSGGSNQTQV
ncbi:RTA1-domain-containing protein [Mycena latifolia]|nr:RTA1-domain-containing protein [Mycena latifolia]